MPSAFSNLRGKWIRIFNHLDAANHGYFELEDMYNFCRRLYALISIPEEHQTDKLLLGSILTENATKMRFGHDKTSLTSGEFLEALAYAYLKNPRATHEVFTRYFAAVFDAIEKNNSGYTGYDGFLSYYLRFGDTPEMRARTAKAFAMIVDHGNNQVSRQKYIESYVKYFLDPETTAEEFPLL